MATTWWTRWLAILIAPVARYWILKILRGFDGRKTPAADLGFPRLPKYFSADFLARINVVVVDRMPFPRLYRRLAGTFGVSLDQICGLALVDTCFIRTDSRAAETVYFHELVHLVQWQYLGLLPFIRRYAEGILRGGPGALHDSDLEAQAYRHQQRFDRDQPPYDVETTVRQELDRSFP